MSMVQYGSSQATTKPKETSHRDDNQDTSSEDDTSVSTASESQVDRVDDDSSLPSNEELQVSTSSVHSSEPRVTRVIDLGEKPKYMDEEEEDEEERELNDELQDLIQSQVLYLVITRIHDTWYMILTSNDRLNSVNHQGVVSSLVESSFVLHVYDQGTTREIATS